MPDVSTTAVANTRGGCFRRFSTACRRRHPDEAGRPGPGQGQAAQVLAPPKRLPTGGVPL
jgi:hypothetical protein